MNDDDDDLQPLDWSPDLDWRPPTAAASLESARATVVEQGTVADAWYLAHHGKKATWAKAARFAIAATLAVGALFPALALANRDLDVASWGYIALAVAGGIYGIDRGMGYSSAWRRYMVTSARIKTRLARAALEWELLRAPLAGRHPTEDEVVERLRYLLGLTDELHRLVEAETDQWSAEFGEAPAALQAAIDAAKPQ